MKRIFLFILLLVIPIPIMAQTQVIVTGGVATIDASLCGANASGSSCAFKVILTANTTVSIINARGGQTLGIFFLENATGGWTVTWPSYVSSPPTISLGANTPTLVSLQYDGSGGTWSVSSGSGNVTPSTAGALPYGVVASPTCPIISSLPGNTCQFVYDDGYVASTIASTTSSTTITCSDCTFTTITQPQFGSSIVGMQAWVVTTATKNTSPVPICPISTITAVNSATSITVTTPCTTTETALGTLVIGHKDDTNLSKAWTTTGCGTLHLPELSANPIAPAGTQAVLLSSIGQFQTRPAAGCSAAAANGMYGDPNLIGSSIGTTIIMTPDFAFTTGNCAGVANAGITTGPFNVCFGPAPVLWHGVDIVGYGFAACGAVQLVITSAGQGGVMELSNHNDICVGNGSIIGTLFYSANYRFLYGGVQNVGSIAALVPGMTFAYPAYSNSNFFVNNVGSNSNTGLLVTAGSILVDHSSIIQNSDIQGTYIGGGVSHLTFKGSGAGLDSAKVNSSTAVFDCTGCTFNASGTGSPANSSTGLWLAVSGARATVRNTVLWQGATGGTALVTAAGTTLTDGGGNTPPVANGGTAVTNSGSIIGSLSIAQTPTVAGNFVPSANFGSGATVTAVTGNATNFTFTLTNGGSAVGANPTIAYTFPAAFWVTPARCSIWQVGGTQAITALTAFLAPSAQSATGVTFTYNGTPTISLTEFYQGSCTN